MTPTSPTHRTGAALAMTLIAGLSLAAAAPALAQDEDQSAPPAEESADADKQPTKGEERLAKLLDGRVAGEPQNCIRNMPTDRMVTIDKTAYVFGRGNTIYVQRTAKPKRINGRDTLVTQRFGGGPQLCRLDIATTIDPFTQFFTGAVMFEDFVPYTRTDESEG